MAIIAKVGILIKFGEKVVKWCQAYRRAEEALGELVVRLENRWFKVKIQIAFLKEWRENIPPDLLIIQAKTLRILEKRLEQAEWTVGDLFPAEEPQPTAEEQQHAVPGPQFVPQKPHSGMLSAVTAAFNHMGPKPKKGLPKMKKAKYAYYETSLNRLVESIKDWQGEFDPTWYYVLSLQQERLKGKKDDPQAIAPTEEPFQEYLCSGSTVTLVGSQAAEATAVGNVASPDTSDAPSPRVPATSYAPAVPSTEQTNFLRDPEFITSTRRHVLFSSVLITSQKADKKPLLLEPMAFDAAADENAITADAQTLAQKLTHTEPLTFGLLQCCGLIKTKSTTSDPSTRLSISFLFALPSPLHSPKSLRSVLINQTKCSLNERFNLAKRLANAVSFVHTAGFVHKNIRPETIVLLAYDESALGLAFLVGFSMFRHVKGQSQLVGDDLVEKNLYRHPSRQGAHPEEKYKMQHDIYSLGVCLLEIGLWRSSVYYEGEDSSDGAMLSPNLDIASSTWDIRDDRERANAVKAALIAMAGTTLKASVGENYANIVVSCLTCMDAEGGMMREEAMGKDKEKDAKKDGLEIGVQYIQQVIQWIHKLSV